MIEFKDFVPKQISSGGFLTPAEYDSFSEAAGAAARWAEAKGVRVINIETVVLPNMHHPHEEGSGDAALRTRGDFQSSWHQFVRVWYAEE